jgi:uncharacterized protein YprB with RNaseH-like and TPR domain
MLRHTFCHIPGIGLKAETNLWARGVNCWDDVLRMSLTEISSYRSVLLKTRVLESRNSLENYDPTYFAESLPTGELWRLFGDFQDSVAYLDIETCPTRRSANGITTVSMYDGKTIFHYVRGQNLDQFATDIQKYKVVVTYNGKCFDIPVLEKSLKIRMNQAHIDLRHLLKSLGYSGGLKGCEKKLGIDRQELDGVNGYFAVLLWYDYRKTNNRKALDTLLAYNTLDAVNLHRLMVMVYNLKLQKTPFYEQHRLEVPQPVPNPFEADIETIERIREKINYVHSS